MGIGQGLAVLPEQQGGTARRGGSVRDFRVSLKFCTPACLAMCSEGPAELPVLPFAQERVKPCVAF